jgi:hypothetical protein
MNLRVLKVSKMDQLIPNDIWIEIVSCLTENDFATLRAIFRLNKAINARIVLFMKTVRVEHDSNTHWSYAVLSNKIKHGPAVWYDVKAFNIVYSENSNYFWGKLHGKSHLSSIMSINSIQIISRDIRRFFEGCLHGIYLSTSKQDIDPTVKFIITGFNHGKIKYIISGVYIGHQMDIYKKLKKRFRMNLTRSQIVKLLNSLSMITYES